MASTQPLRITTGTLAFDGGVNSSIAPYQVSEVTPRGLKPNQLAWMDNCTVRGGGITCRNGMIQLTELATALHQGTFLYQPDSGFPYHIVAIAGTFYKVNSGTDNSVETITYGTPPPPGPTYTSTIYHQAGPAYTADAAYSGAWVGADVIPVTYSVQISYSDPTHALPDQIRWNKDGGAWTDLGDIVAGPIALTDGMFINFGGTGFHNLGDYWTIVVIPAAWFNHVQPLSTTAEQYWFCQANRFLIIQDGIHECLVWDGALLRHCSDVPHPAGLASLPIGTCMDYYQGRVWIGNGRQYAAGDLVGNTASGTAAYGYEDSVLRMTENAYLAMGGTFVVPTTAGNITAIRHSANIDINMGDGSLFIFTRKAIYTLAVPIDRTAWQDFTTDTLPVQRVAQIRWGTQGDRAIVRVNGDIFYQSPDGVRSMKMAQKDFQTWDNTPISNNEMRVLQYNDRSLMKFCSAIEFDQRLLVLALPLQTDVGVVFQGIMPLDLAGIGTLEEKMPPAWEGVLEGLDILQLTEGDFGGVQRAFATVKSRVTGNLALWEITNYLRRDGDDNRITWFFETCSYNWGTAFDKKKLDGFRLWVDKLYGTVDYTVYYRADQHPCWQLWGQWQECAARDECEDLDPPLPCDYPEQIYREQYRIPMTLGSPQEFCEDTNNRPMAQLYSVQVKVVIKGWCRVRGLLVHGIPMMESPYEGHRCALLEDSVLT